MSVGFAVTTNYRDYRVKGCSHHIMDRDNVEVKLRRIGYRTELNSFLDQHQNNRI